MPTQQKEETVAQIAEAVRGAQAVLLADYRGLTVAQISDLRKRLRESGTDFSVVKNTLFRRATEDIVPPSAELDAVLNNPTAAAFVREDPVAAARVFTDYIRDHRNTPLTLKGGVVGGRFFTADQVTQLSRTPPREVLIAQMLGSFQAPISGLVGTLNSILGNFVFTLQAIVDQKQQPEQAG